jgi:hypothetical protein
MADVLVKQSVLAQNLVFRDRVRAAMFVTMTAVAGEAVGAMTSSVYQKRQTYALAVLSNQIAHIDRFAWAVAANPTIGTDINPPVAIASSTNANPVVITTAAAHGYVNGDTVEIASHAANTSANGGWIVTTLTSTTFSIPAAGVGVGSATGTATKHPSDADVQFTVNSLVNDFAGVTALD